MICKYRNENQVLKPNHVQQRKMGLHEIHCVNLLSQVSSLQGPKEALKPPSYHLGVFDLL